jgi:hypothetical protein
MRLQVDPRRADAHFCIYWLRSPRMRRADVDDQAVVLVAHGGEHGAGDAKQADDVLVEDGLRLLRGEGFG